MLFLSSFGSLLSCNYPSQVLFNFFLLQTLLSCVRGMMGFGKDVGRIKYSPTTCCLSGSLADSHHHHYLLRALSLAHGMATKAKNFPGKTISILNELTFNLKQTFNKRNVSVCLLSVCVYVMLC